MAYGRKFTEKQFAELEMKQLKNRVDERKERARLNLLKSEVEQKRKRDSEWFLDASREAFGAKNKPAQKRSAPSKRKVDTSVVAKVVYTRSNEARRASAPISNMPPVSKRSKYGNKKAIVGDRTFDSRKEANRFIELRNNPKRYHNLSCQQVFEIVVFGKPICKYIADFVYFDMKLQRLVVEDVKSKITRKLPVYRLKKKLVEAAHGIEILET